MATLIKKISELTAATTLGGTEIIPLVQSGTTKKSTLQLMIDTIIPIGMVYYQGPNDSSPNTLWPMTTWTDVSWEEAGTVGRISGDSTNGNLSWVSYSSVVPVRFGVSVSVGVPTITVVSGGSGYLSGGSGSISLVIIGTCTTQMVATATITSGVATAISVSTPGAGYTAGSVGVYDGVVRLGDKFMKHWHDIASDSQGNLDQRDSISTAGADSAVPAYSGATADTVGARAIITTGADETPRTDFETTGAYTVKKKWRRTA